MKKMMFLALLLNLLMIGLLPASSTDTLEVRVLGTGANARFEPVVLQAESGDVVRFIVAEGMHTVTAYHPENRRPLRMPETANSFDSGLLSEGDVWYVEVNIDGVYDYFCMPHEKLGHAGRILVGEVSGTPDYLSGLIPEVVEKLLSAETRKILDSGID
jgi:plastocyanin